MPEPLTTGGTPFLNARLQSQLGHFSLRTEFSLSSAWTILFGPSGSGKSSLLRMLAGLLRPDEGVITFGGRMIVDTATRIWIPPGKRRIGFVAQQPALFQHMTVAENVAFGLSGASATERQQRVEAILRLVQAEALTRRMPAELSGGEQQRVTLARALAPEPKLILLDEPFSALDAKLKESMLPALTRWLEDRAIPAFYVSHDVSEALQTTAEVIVMHDGAIIAQGAAAEVLHDERARLLRMLGV